MVRRLVHLRHDDWDRPRCSICRAGRAGEIDLLRIEKLLAHSRLPLAWHEQRAVLGFA